MDPLRGKAAMGRRADDQKAKLPQVSRFHITDLEQLTAEGIADSPRNLLRIPIG